MKTTKIIKDQNIESEKEKNECKHNWRVATAGTGDGIGSGDIFGFWYCTICRKTQRLNPKRWNKGY